MGIPANLGAVAAGFMADHVFNRLDIQGWMARTGFQMLDPLKTARRASTSSGNCTTAKRCCPQEQQRRFLDSEGWIAWSGPAVSELLKQFIAHNRLMSGGFAINGQLVTLNDITCPCSPSSVRVDDISQPASVRGIRQAAPLADDVRNDDPGRSLRPGRRLESLHHLADGRRLGALGGRHRSAAEQRRTDAGRPATHGKRRHRRAVVGAGCTVSARPPRSPSRRARSAADRRRGQQVGAHPGGGDRANLPRLTRLGQINDHPNLVGPHHFRAGQRIPPGTASLLFDGRVHTYEAVDRRINNVVRV